MRDAASNPEPGQRRASDRVPVRERLALGSGGLPLFLGTAAIGSIAIPYYQMTLKVDPKWLALALVAPRFLDAFLDPFVGRFSDNLRSRFGRRKPLMVVGAIIQALAFGSIWMVPPDASQSAIKTWLVVSQLVFYAGFSLFSVALAALQYELTPDYEERTRVSAVGGFFGKVGEVGYNYVFPIASSAMFVSAISGVRTLGWIIGIVFLGLLPFIPVLFVRERPLRSVERHQPVRLWPSLCTAFSSRAFVILIGLTLLQIVAGMFASNLDRYLLVYFMSGGDVGAGELLKGNLSVAYAIVGIVAIYPVNWLAQRIGKTRALITAFVLTFLGALGKWILFTPGFRGVVPLDAVLCGPVWIAINVLTPSMLADICDEDELRSGQRREGVYGAIFSWIQKLGYSAAFFGAMWSLDLTGFQAGLGGAQTPDTILRLRVILAGSTAVWAVLAIVLLNFYPLSRHRAHEIRAQLEARRGAA